MAATKQILTVSMDRVLADKMQGVADAQGISRSAFIENCVRQAIDQEGMMLRALSNPFFGEHVRKIAASPETVAGLLKAMNNPASAREVERMQRLFSESVKQIRKLTGKRPKGKGKNK